MHTDINPGTLYYLLGDHPSLSLGTSLGSMAITTDSNGVKSAEIRYYPWGRHAGAAVPPRPPTALPGRGLRARLGYISITHAGTTLILTDGSSQIALYLTLITP